MSVANSAWCVQCGAAPEMTISVEVDGYLAHFGSCRRCSAGVLVQVVDTIERAERRARERAVRKVSGYIDASHQWIDAVTDASGEE